MREKSSRGLTATFIGLALAAALAPSLAAWAEGNYLSIEWLPRDSWGIGLGEKGLYACGMGPCRQILTGKTLSCGFFEVSNHYRKHVLDPPVPATPARGAKTSSGPSPTLVGRIAGSWGKNDPARP